MITAELPRPIIKAPPPPGEPLPPPVSSEVPPPLPPPISTEAPPPPTPTSQTTEVSGVVDESTEEVVESATPLKEGLVSNFKLLTTEQQKRDELEKKSNKTVEEITELHSLNSQDPFHRYEEIKKLITEGKKVEPEDQKFAEDFEETEVFKKMQEDNDKKAIAESIADSKKEQAGSEATRALLEATGANGKVSKALELHARGLMQSGNPQDNAMGLDIMIDALTLHKFELTKEIQSTRKAKKSNELAGKIEATDHELDQFAKQRSAISEEHPELSSNQFADLARVITGSTGAEQHSVMLIHDHFTKLVGLKKDDRTAEIVRWKESGVISEDMVNAIKKIFTREHAGKTAEAVRHKVMRISTITGLLVALSVWAAAKKAGEGGQTGR